MYTHCSAIPGTTILAKDSKKQKVSDDEALLEFKVGPFRFCAPALDVEGIISPPEMIQVPYSTDIVAGCFVHQKRTVTVLSMHNKFGLPFTRKEKQTHIILATVDNGLKGFWVDQAIDVVQLSKLDRITNYYLHERKAYSNFLTRDEDILLQTSFQRLYKCARSHLYWTACLEAGKTVAVSEEDITTSTTTSVAASSSINQGDQAAEAAIGLHQPGAIDTDKNTIAANSAANNGITRKAGYHDATPAANAVISNSRQSSEQASHKLVANADYSANSHPVIKQKADDSKAHTEGTISNKLTQPYNQTDSASGTTARVTPPASNPYTQHTSRPYPAGSSRHAGLSKPASTNVTAENGAGNTFTNDEALPAAASHAYSPSRPLNEMPDASSGYSNTTRDGSYARQQQTQAYRRNVSGNETEDDKRNLLPLAAALLALCALGLGSMYLLDDDNGPAIKHPTKVTATRGSSSYTTADATDNTYEQPLPARETNSGQNTVDTEATAANSMDTANLIESTPADTEPMEKDTLDELAQADATAVPSANPRVIELHVNEQPDSPLAAITSPEPVTHQQFSVLGTQEFTHVVVKGDTLWHITRRYLGNPFRYPELAASSQINNPHLIYPGDVIKITVNRAKNQ